MNVLKSALLVSALVTCGVLSASAQTSSNSMSGSPAATDTVTVSPSTHCRDGNGHIELKRPRNSVSSGASSSSSANSGTVGSATSNSSTLGTGSEATTAASLPSCSE
jgi:hypothetical protein